MLEIVLRHQKWVLLLSCMDKTNELTIMIVVA